MTTITVTPLDGAQGLIGFETNIFGHIARQVASLQDDVVRQQLIAAGWIPPAAVAVPSGWSFNVKRSDGRVWLTISTPHGASATLSAAEKTGNGDDTIVAQVLDYLATTQAAPQPAAQHPDDAAVDALAALMKAKLAKQRAKGYGGWDDRSVLQQELSYLLRTHVEKGDPVDVANFCAFLSARGEGIAAKPQEAAPVAQGDAEDAARWRMLPAFIEAHQIDYVRLLNDIDAARSKATEGSAA